MIDTILNFWFEELEPKQWFIKDNQLDNEIEKRFGALHQQATQGELYSWRDTAKGSLAEIIILDQFSRNIFRDQASSFAFDSMALTLAQVAISKQFDKDLTPQEKSFLYMPFMHSESLAIHNIAQQLFNQPGLEHNLDFEKKHRIIIEKFGRYPHRNQILGRTSTSEELTFLQKPNSSF